MMEVATFSLVEGLPALPRHRVIEVCGQSSSPFALLAAERMQGQALWVRSIQSPIHPYGHGLSFFIAPNRLCFVGTATLKDTLWAAEEGLRSGGVGSVLVDLPRPPSLTETRRLQLAAAEGQSLGLILCPPHQRATAATMRWMCDPVSSCDWDSTHWQWKLIKNKIGTIGLDQGWVVAFHVQTRALDLVSKAGSRPRHAPEGLSSH